jgi:hypothetical protein
VKIQKTFFYTLQALYFGRFSIFAEQWVIYNYASILEVFTIISIAVFSVFNSLFMQLLGIILNKSLWKTDYRSLP